MTCDIPNILLIFTALLDVCDMHVTYNFTEPHPVGMDLANGLDPLFSTPVTYLRFFEVHLLPDFLHFVVLWGVPVQA